MSLPRFSVGNPVFVNMLVIVTIVGGAVFAATLIREMFPESRPNQISILAVYPSVQPDEVERAVTIKVEEAVRDIKGIEKVNSTVSEGLSQTTLTLYNSVKDVDVVLQEVKNEVDSLQDIPEGVEKLTVTKVEPTLPVIMVTVYGEDNEAELKRTARGVRDDLLELPGVSDVTISGLRNDEISVEVRPEKLLEYNITFEEVALAIRQTNLDVSAGNLKGDRSQVAVRTMGEKQRGVDLENIEVRALPDGRVIRIRDVATVIDGYIDSDVKTFFEGKRAANLIVQKTSDQDAIQISTLIKAYVAGKKNAPFPPPPENPPGWFQRGLNGLQAGINKTVDVIAGRPDPQQVYEQSLKNPLRGNFQLATRTDLARFVEGRLDLMVRNGKSGLVLVLVCLLFFMNWRVALWTALGMPVAFLGTFIMMALVGVSLNLLSMFGLIIVLGIIVDDAIVIGENIYRRVEEGMPAHQAAILGAEEVMWPVIVAVSTTMASFAPLLFIRGQIGDFFRELPLVVVCALSVSLVEALIVLPTHLRHLPTPSHHDHTAHWWDRLGSLLTRVQRGFIEFLMRIYSRILRFVLRWRYVALAVSVSLLTMSLGLFIGKTPNGYTLGNVVSWQFIQKMDAESMYAQIEMPIGSTADSVEERLRVLSDFATAIPEVDNVSMDVAAVINAGGPGGSTSGNIQSHLGQLWVELLAADTREEKKMRSSQEVLAVLRKQSESLTGVNSVKWEVMNGGPGGKDLEIRISGEDFEEIRQVAEEIKQHLATYDGVVDLDDDFDEGKRELQLELMDSARPTGVTRAALGGYIRAATFGAEARRITRNREDVKIMVRYPQIYREDAYHIEGMWIPIGTPGPTGEREWIPLQEVARVNETRGYTQIHRYQQKRSITVLGDVDDLVTRVSDVTAKVKAEFLPELQRNHPKLKIEFLGSAEEQAKAFGSLTLAFPVAMLMIYMMLAGLFRSYVQPIVVMTAIPFGIQGAIVGHWLTGNPMTILSAIGMVALTGIVVNDSLVLVDFINTRIREGATVFQASVDGATLRLRPILLTTVTTVAGLTPLMFEKSFQAKFMIPMAVTLTFGLAFATALTLIIVPVLNMIFYDIRRDFLWLTGWEDELHHAHREEPYETSDSRQQIRETVAS